MPYQLVSAKVRGNDRSAIWEDADLGQTDINAIFKNYSRIILTLTHTVVSGTFYLNLEDARSQIGVYTGTKLLEDWLESLGNAALPTMAQAPSFREYPVLYSDAWRAGYTVTPVDGTRHPDAQLPDRDKNDLLLKRGNVNFKQYGNYMMATVNGFFHRVVGTEYGAVVMNGGRTGYLCDDNHVGVFSFREVGAIQYIPITPTMIYKQDEDQRYADYAMIQSPVNLDDRIVLLVIGGYLHVLDGAYDVIGSRAIRVNTDTLSYVDRVLESVGKIDLSTLGLEPSENNEFQFSLEELFDDQTIRAYLSLPQSFMVLLPKTDLYVRKTAVEQTKLAGRYYTDYPFVQLPLVSVLGKIYDYAPFPERGVTVLACDPIRRYRRNFHTALWKEEISVTPQSLPSDPFEWGDAYLWEFGRAA